MHRINNMSTYWNKYKGRGWHNESYRHYLASKGIKTAKLRSRTALSSNTKTNLPPGFNYAVGENKGVLSGIFNEAFDVSAERNQKIESFEVGMNNKAVNAIEKLMDAPERAMQVGERFEVKSPLRNDVDDDIQASDFEMVRANEDIDIDDEEYFSHHTSEARSENNFSKKFFASDLPWLDDLPWSRDELRAISNGFPPEEYVNIYGTDKVPREHRKQARVELEEDDLIPGGLADHAQDDEFDPIQLQKGVMVEMVHTDDREVAKELAQDNLAKDPLYYEKVEELGLA